MPLLRIGLRLESLRLPIRQALRRAAELGVQGVQFDALGNLAPDQLSATGRRELLHLIRTQAMSLTSVGFPVRQAYSDAEGLERRLSELRKVLTLSYELRAPIVTGAIGRVPDDPTHPARQTLADAMTEVGRHAERVGAVFAIETGPETGATLKNFIASLGGMGIRASLDPSNLLIKGYDPIQAVRDLGDFVVHSYGRDAIREAGGTLGREATPGDGDLDWNEYLGALEEIAYRGWVVIKREQAPDPIREVDRAVKFLRRF